MNCRDFREWLAFRETRPDERIHQALEHARSCADCATRLQVDDHLEQTVRQELARVNTPLRLRSGIELSLKEPRRAHNLRGLGWRSLGLPAGALAGVLLVLFFWLPLGQDLSSIGRIASLAEQNHHAGYDMSFSAAEVTDITDWFSGKLDFDVVVPDLTDRGLNFLGGRKCTLGGREIAYLFYADKGKPYSLFEISAADVSAELVEGKTYRYPLEDCVVEIWKAAGRVYALVS